MSESRLPMKESRPDVIEVTAVPLERARQRRPEKRSLNLLGFAFLAIFLLMIFKFLVIVLILAMLVVLLPRTIQGGFGKLMRSLLPQQMRGRWSSRGDR